ncbi:non-ribosomal peptide synthetase [Desulfoluna butyratoxydans]|uniref:Amp-dependent synthetase/ligase n=1 Tax=Desulfoluna butyratoxydans TaxID=231438 RepID=A0A4U8YRC3_9BACT|nr:non-ribosomal peptide synthetase [Desulfoluna butyratoxydans]VFQ46274.1 amp-dependent synthetase/ligase [Desulfoluna butyratoxydans]
MKAKQMAHRQWNHGTGEFVSVVDMLKGKAAGGEEAPVFSYRVDESCGEASFMVEHLTYTELDARARAIGNRLRREPCRGKRALLFFPAGLEFVKAFYGCLYAGVIPVPVNCGVSPGHISRVRAILSDAVPGFVLTEEKAWGTLMEGFANLFAGSSGPKLMVTDNLDPLEAEDGDDVVLTPESIALLQYTSGSTASPKGVILTHGNLMHNLSVLTEAWGLEDEGMRQVSWLPHHHITGLICNVLLPVYAGVETCLMSPEAFAEKPERWMRAVSKHKAHLTGAPNFAYDLAAECASEAIRNEIDLSSLKVAYNIAEPVKADTLRRFADAWAPNGFSMDTFYPMYGLSEATLHVAGGFCVDHPGFDDHGAVCLGRSAPGTRLVVADPEIGAPLPDGKVGEVRFASESVARGYWEKDEETRETFAKGVSGRQGAYLRTGDLGFLQDGALFLTGRIKDLIIIRGTNHFPVDIEGSVERALRELPANGCAAFSVGSESGEALIVVQEAATVPPDISHRIREAVSRDHQLVVQAVVLIAPGTLPRTASGKIQRLRCRQMYLEGSLEEIARHTLDAGGHRSLRYGVSRQAFAGLSFHEQKGMILESLGQAFAGELAHRADSHWQHMGLVSLGLDSLDLAQLKDETESHFRVHLDISAFFDPAFTAEAFAETVIRKTGDTDAWSEPLPVRALQGAETPFDLTDLQSAYWIGRSEVFDYGGVSSHLYVEAEVCGDLDAEVLNRSWNSLVAQHDMLRMVVTPDGRQRIVPSPPEFIVQVHDLTGQDAGSTRQDLALIRQGLSHRKIDAETWPLFDVHYTRLEKGLGRLHVSMDLLVADIWSFNMLMGQWFRLYNGDKTALRPLEISFRDHVAHEAAATSLPVYARARAYWEARMATLPGAPQLPLETSTQGDSRFVNREFRLSRGRWQRLKKRARDAGVTPSNLLMAAYCRVLANWSKDPDFSLNVTLFNRSTLHPDMARVVGDFTTVLILGVTGVGETSFGSFAREIQAQLARDLEHRSFSGIEVIRGLEKEGDTSAAMPVVFTGALSLKGGLGISKETFFGDRVFKVTQTPQVILDNQVYEEEGELVVSWDAVESLFPGETVKEMFAAYTSLVEALERSDGAWESRGGDMIPGHQLDQRMAVNDTAVPMEPETLHRAFVARAMAHPEREAVITSSRSVTYGELLGAAVSLSRELMAAGAGPGEVVALHLAKGWEQVAAVMGSLLTGAAYVHVDPGLPEERKRILFTHSGACAVVVASPGGAVPGADAAIPVVSMGEERLVSLEETSLDPDPSRPGDPAYLIFTSGSTGTPKGVVTSHGSAFNTVADISEKIDLTPGDRVLALSSLSFDLSVYDLFGLLGVGGAVVVPDPGEERNPAHWLEMMQRHGVTVWNSVPALLEMLVAYAQGGEALKGAALRVSLLSGDRIGTDLPARAMAQVPGVKVISLGGATEASIWSIWYPIEEGEVFEQAIPYGRPLANQTMYVLNRQFGHCPDYVPGDLYIGGAGLAMGYLNDADKTARAFIVHPATGERLYRTGDLGYAHPDGTIRFLGREDFQVKVGGFRVEPGEIEAVLNRYPTVAGAAVRKETGEDGNAYLSAYVVTGDAKGARSDGYDYGMEIEGAPGVPLLTDKDERRLFTLRQTGLREVPGPSLALEPGPGFGGYERRSTTRRFVEESVSFATMCSFLAPLRRQEEGGLKRYAYASAGGLYPVRAYLYVKQGRVEGVPGGVYYYNPKTHGLQPLSYTPVGEEAHVIANRPIHASSAFSLFLVGDLDAMAPMYGVRSRDFCLLEAGLMTQLLENGAAANGMGLCQIGAFRDEGAVARSLGLDDTHLLLHGMEGGMADFSDPRRGLPMGADKGAPAPGTSLEELRAHARSLLPRYMVPAAWTEVDAIPLTPTGKVDYKGLSDIPGRRLAVQAVTRRPENELESLVSRVFEALLKQDGLDTDANFFEFGADSLSVVRAWREITEETGLSFPVAAMFEHPTIRDLAAYLAGLGCGNTPVPVLSSVGADRRQALRKRLGRTRRPA